MRHIFGGAGTDGGEERMVDDGWVLGCVVLWPFCGCLMGRMRVN